MELYKGFHFLKVEKTGIVDSSSILVIRDAKGLICVDIGGGGESNIHQTLRLFELERLKVADIHTVIISHTHADHMGAIGYFRELVPRIIVVDHEIDAPFLQDNTQLNRIFDTDLAVQHFPANRFDILDFYRTFCPISETTPDRVVVEGEILECGEFLFEVIHTPGHHPGHISLFSASAAILFCGDSMITDENGIHGSRPIFTWDADKASAAVRRQAALGARILCSGHGPVVMDAAGKFPV